MGLKMNLAKLRDHARGRTGHRRGVYRYTLIRFGGFQDCEIKRFEDLLHRGKATTDFIDGMPSLTTTSYVLDRRAQGELPLHVLDGRARALIDKGRGPETLFVVSSAAAVCQLSFDSNLPRLVLLGVTVAAAAVGCLLPLVTRRSRSSLLSFPLGTRGSRSHAQRICLRSLSLPLLPHWKRLRRGSGPPH